MAEIAARSPEYVKFGSLRSIYFGGGTPSLWDSQQLKRIIDFASETFGLQSNAEITLECNPEKLEPDYLEAARNAQINRISLGSQSLVQKELVQLGRLHKAHDSIAAIKHCKELDFSVSVDVIFGTPNQTSDQLDRTLLELLDQPIDHISTYALTIEEDTAFDRQVKTGRFHPMSDDEQAERMQQLGRRIQAAGFEHYEVSAFGKDGHRAIHNSLYWLGAPFLGVGAGAHSYHPGDTENAASRRETIRNPVTYTTSAQALVFPAGFTETLSPEQVLMERIMVGTRVKWGLTLDELPWGRGRKEKIAAMQTVIDELHKDGMLHQTGNFIWPSERGLLFADTIARKLVDTATKLIG